MISITKGISEENVKVLYSHPIMNRITTDDYTPSFIDNPFVDYYSCFDDDIFVGAFMVIRNSIVDYDVHLLLLPCSIYNSRSLCILMANEIFTTANRITAKVFGRLKTIQNLLRKLGFKEEGIMREAYIKDGKLDNIHIFGLLKSEWECV